MLRNNHYGPRLNKYDLPITYECIFTRYAAVCLVFKHNSHFSSKQREILLNYV